MKHRYSLSNFFATNTYSQLKLYAFLLLSFLFASNTYGASDVCDNGAGNQIPVNSACTGAIFFANVASTTFIDASGTGCGADNSIDAWGFFVATSTQTTVEYNPGADDVILSIYSGACAGLTYEGCSNAGGPGVLETVTVTTVIGVTYRIRIQTGNASALNVGFICAYNSGASGPPANDDPCTAEPLTVNATCTFSTYDSTGATDSGIADPGCADYQGEDVWFSAVVPASGNITIDTDDNGAVTDSGIALYTGTCGALTLVECDDDDSPNGALMSTITRSGLTPGSTVYIRFWEFGGGTGNFDICVNEPVPCAQPTVTAATLVSFTTATINWTGTAPAPAIGYEYVVSTTNTAPTGGGTAWFGTNRALTGLTNGTTYYVFVRSNCGSGLYSPWDGPVSFTTTAYSPCVTPGPATVLTFGAIDDSSIAGSFTAPVPVADSYLVLMNTTGIAPAAPADGIAYVLGDTSLGATVVDNDGNTNFTATGLTFTTQYYFYIYPFNDNQCLNAPAYSNTALTGTATTTTCLASSTNTSDFIDDFDATGDGVSNIVNNNTGTGVTSNGYSDYTAMTVTQLEGGTVFFNANFNGTYGFNIWVDFNDDLNFTPAELVYASGAFVGGVTAGSFPIPGGTAGTHVMRIRADDLTDTPFPCGNITWGEAEDYTITITPLNCTADPSNVTATPTSTTTADISWQAAVPAPTLGYDWVLSTSPTGTPVIASGTIAGTSVTGIAVVANTTYYAFVRGNCGPPDGQGVWYTASFNTGCANIVNTATADPMVIGEQGVNPLIAIPYDSDPSFTVDCTSGSVTLEAYSDLHDTSSYAVEKIAYNPPVPYSSFAASTAGIDDDDEWSNAWIPLGFDFCFYDNTYDQCLVGSNGAVTFNPAEVPSGGTGWTITDLPGIGTGTNSLIEQTIYGVYHDVDPTFCSTCEITTRVLNPTNIGYRKFVVAWHDVPMWSDTTRLYTGMIILHETTNIIEVFIEEKRIENGNVSPAWGGNALVGIQGDITPLAPNNQYAVAPCRNSEDPNWEITNEAWRFVPDGPAIPATSVTWYQGSGTGGSNLGTSNTVSVNAPGIYTAAATYATCNGPVTILDEVTITGSGKTWLGGTSSDWMVAANWSDGTIPLATDCVVIPNMANDPIIYNGDHGNGLNVTIEANAVLTIQPNASVTIQDYIVQQGNGTIFVDSSGSLIQVNDTPSIANSGTITVERDANIRQQDYVYWSTPVASKEIENVSTATPNGYKYQWTPTLFQGVGPVPVGNMVFGDWDPYDVGPMDVGRGYIIKGPTGHSATPANYTASFTGIANNGEILQPITSGDYTGVPYAPFAWDLTIQVTNKDDNWNLVGNPYPSAIDAELFLTHANNLKLEGAVHIWTHADPYNNTTFDDPFYEDFEYNYDPNGYMTYNKTGPSIYTPALFSGNIASGQGFFVLALNDNESGNITFNNSMRSTTNNDFYRLSNNSDSQQTESDDDERHRIWLDLVSPNNLSSTMMVGYVYSATLGKDRMYDASSLEVNFMNLYSKIGEDRMIIQGRPLPFNEEDQIPLGAVVNDLGTHSIAIKGVDGLFLDNEQNIYLEDLYENVIHDLRNTPYVFTVTEPGTIDERFILRYTTETLGINEFDDDPDLTIIAPNSKYIKITSANEMIKSVVVYDLLGRVLINELDLNTTEIIMNDIAFSDGPYFVKATLANGRSKIKKIVLKH